MFELLERFGKPLQEHPIVHALLRSLRESALRRLMKPGAHEIPAMLKALQDNVDCALSV